MSLSINLDELAYRIDSTTQCSSLDRIQRSSSSNEVATVQPSLPNDPTCPTGGRSNSKPVNLLSIYYQNVRGLRTKTSKLRLLLSSCDYDMLVLTETWLHSDIDSAEISSDYVLFRCDRSNLTSNCSRGGGVLIAVKCQLKCESVSLEDCDRLEQIVVRLKMAHRSMYVLAIYIPPRSNTDLYAAHASAVEQIANLANKTDVILSIGDFNLPNLRWKFDEQVNGYYPSNISSEPEQSLVETLLSTGLQQVNNLVNMNGNLLDLVFVSLPELLDLIAAPVPLLPVDNHHAPFILLIDETEENISDLDDLIGNSKLNFKACDFIRLNDELAGIDWHFLQRCSTVDETLSAFYGKLREKLNDFVPRMKCKSTSVFSKPWWNAELRNLRNILRKQRKRFFLSKTEETRENLREVEAAYKSLLVSSYENYISTIQSNVKQNPSHFWDFVRRQKCKTRIPKNVNFNGSQACSNGEAAELFASFFESVFSRTAPVPRRDCFAHIPQHNISLPVMQFSENEVLEVVNDLDISKGPGTDAIPPLLLKNCCATLAEPIAFIFNRSLRERTFPAAWKSAFIVPIHKSGNSASVTNYRGVSILCCLSKVLEKMVHNVIYSIAAPLISTNQHGFMKYRSTTSNLMCYVNTISNELEQGRQVDSIYVDFAKAFDTVPHATIISKLWHIGFPDWLVEWLSSYLSDRSAQVVVNFACSQPFSITSGVPQGSVLGPLLFNIFVNDLCLLLKSFSLSFADDLKMYRTITSQLDCVALQEDVNTMLVWCGDNGMRVNSAKCKVITFNRCHRLIVHEYYIDSDPLQRVKSICDLGVTIDEKLRFNEHIGTTVAKAFSVLGFIRRNAVDFTDIYALKTLFCSLVRSILEYAAPVWCPHYTTQILAIERVQRKFIRFALRNLPWNDPANLPPYPDRCRLIGLETLSSRRAKMQCLLIFDVMQGNIDSPALLEQIPFNTPPRRFRNSPMLAVPYHRTNFGCYNAFDFCLRVFNSISEEFDFNVSKNVFCIRIRDRL